MIIDVGSKKDKKGLEVASYLNIEYRKSRLNGDFYLAWIASSVLPERERPIILDISLSQSEELKIISISSTVHSWRALYAPSLVFW